MKYLVSVLFLLFSFNAMADLSQVVSVDQAVARAAIKQQRNSAVFMKLLNQGDDAQLVYAKSPVAGIVELHTHINDKGVMRMRKINQIDLPNQQLVSLQPGGLHVMLLGLNRDLKPGEEIEVTLGFSDGSEKNLRVPVQIMKMGNMKHPSMHEGKAKSMAH
jgi:copper(I)-binding protein